VPSLHIQFGAQGQTPEGQTVQLPPSVGLLQRGPLVQVSVRLFQDMANELTQRGIELPQPVSGIGLIDTGASVTCIDESIAQNLRLPVVDVVPMASASHSTTLRNVYPISFEIVNLVSNINAPRAIGAELNVQGLILLIGRDVLQFCTLFYNGFIGQITLSI